MGLGIASIRSLVMAVTLSAGSLSVTSASAEEVYMIRGFLNVFSNGMNQMTRRLKSVGIRASAHSNGDWRKLARSIIARSKRGAVSYPIVIVGHSLGGVEAPDFANTLGRAGVTVGLVIGLDPGFHTPKPFGRGIRQVVNYKIPSGKHYRRGLGFKGSMQTFDVSKYGVDHVGIDKNKKVQSIVISRIRSKVGK